MKIPNEIESLKKYLYYLTCSQAPATPTRTRRRPISIANFQTPIARSKPNDVDVTPTFNPSSPSMSVIGELKKRQGLGEDLIKSLRKVAPPPPPPTSTIPGVHGGVAYPTTQHSTFTKSHHRRLVFKACFPSGHDLLRNCRCGRCDRVWI